MGQASLLQNPKRTSLKTRHDKGKFEEAARRAVPLH